MVYNLDTNQYLSMVFTINIVNIGCKYGQCEPY